jgi:hypothetical protein
VAERFRASVLSWGWFPQIPVLFFGQPIIPAPQTHRREFAGLAFWYNRWCLERLVTWHLPLPIQPGFPLPSLYDPDHTIDAGMTVFVPWYLLRDRGLTMSEIAEHRQFPEQRHHLGDWLGRIGGKWGHRRYAQMLALYVYWELALHPRYSGRLRGRTAALERAFARMLLAQGGCTRRIDSRQVERRAESIRKLRKYMRRRLKQAAECQEGGFDVYLL